MNCNTDNFHSSLWDLTDLFRSTAADEEFDRIISLEKYDINGEFPEPVRIRGTVRNSLGVITFKAAVNGVYRSECARCAEEVALELESKLNTVLTQNGAKDDSVTIENGKVDLAKTAYDALSLEIPLIVLCKDDCLGLCSQCGMNLNNGECNCVQ